MKELHLFEQILKTLPEGFISSDISNLKKFDERIEKYVDQTKIDDLERKFPFPKLEYHLKQCMISPLKLFLKHAAILGILRDDKIYREEVAGHPPGS